MRHLLIVVTCSMGLLLSSLAVAQPTPVGPMPRPPADPADPKDPDACNVFALLKLFADEQEVSDIAANYRAGGYGYGQAKARLAELVNERFAPARDRYAELENDPDHVSDVLREGGRKAREVAEATMQRVRAACGIVTNR